MLGVQCMRLWCTILVQNIAPKFTERCSCTYFFCAFVQMDWRVYNSDMVAHRVRLMFYEHAVLGDTDLPTFRPTCRSTNSPTDMFKAIYPSMFDGKLDLHCSICSRKYYIKISDPLHSSDEITRQKYLLTQVIFNFFCNFWIPCINSTGMALG